MLFVDGYHSVQKASDKVRSGLFKQVFRAVGLKSVSDLRLNEVVSLGLH